MARRYVVVTRRTTIASETKRQNYPAALDRMQVHDEGYSCCTYV